MVESVCSAFGEPIEFEGAKFYAFPKPERLAEAEVRDLEHCGLGYRAPFMKRVAASVVEGRIDFTEITELDYEAARKQLLRELFGEKILLGVGPKVADCVLLYSCGKNDAFPIDVWIARELLESYPRLIPRDVKGRLRSGRKLTVADYNRVSNAARKYFGDYAGYAQQYLYSMARFRPTASP
jgi:N-glycosylase/DNA lyase